MGDIIKSLPNNNCEKRNDIILDAVINDKAEYRFSEIKSSYKNHAARFRVFSDALKIEGVRVNVSAQLQQKIADHLGCLLMTAKIADLRFQHSETIIKPHTRYDKTGGTLMSTTTWMKWHSFHIDVDIDKIKHRDIEMVDTVGKHWILDEKLIGNRAVNYGWHYMGVIPGVPKDLPVLSKDMPGVKMIQSRGYHHDSSHTDYSQVCVLVARECEIDGSPYDLAEVLTKEDELSYLASHTGKLHTWRQPDVPDPGVEFIPYF